MPNCCQVPGTGNYGFTVNCGDTLTLPTVCFASCDPCCTWLYRYKQLIMMEPQQLMMVHVHMSTCGNITGIYVDNIIHDRVVFNWDDMNYLHVKLIKLE